MQSPFPGMDPYLEKHWREVHHRLITYIGDFLQAELPSSLRAVLEERVVLEQPAGDFRSAYPDVYVLEHRQLPDASQEGETKATVALEEEPLLVFPQIESPTEGYIEIVDSSSGERVVTVIEILSPTNKSPGRDRSRYLRKQRAAKRAGGNLVEIDLTRAGRRTMAIAEATVPEPYRTIYRICARAPESRGDLNCTAFRCCENCRLFEYPFDPPTPTFVSICNLSWTGVTQWDGTTSITARSPSRL